MKKWLILLFLCVSSALATAENGVDFQPLSNEEAFIAKATAKDYQTILVSWKIAPGYYLYRDRFHFQIIKPEGGRLAQALLPSAIWRSSPLSGRHEVYSNQITIAIPVICPQGKKILLEVDYQGCSEKDYCYPPVSKIFSVDLTGNYLKFTSPLPIDVAPPQEKPTSIPKASQPSTQNLGDLFHKNPWLWAISFLGLGILIAFTPCVLPMVPILSAIISGQKKITTAHAFFLSLAYVLGMAITYAIAGMIVGVIGGSLQASLQQPWILVLFSLLFVAMAFSLFGFFNLELPNKWRNKMATLSEHQKRGSYLGVFFMGILSTLILSPCVTPPLVAVLSYIGQSGNAWIGGAALFIMALGMGTPLLLLGLAHGKLIPHTGPWMNTVKNLMGFLMLGMAIWILDRILPPMITLVLWSALLIIVAIYLDAFRSVQQKKQIFHKAIGILLFIYALLLGINGILGYTNPMKPFAFLTKSSSYENTLSFKKVNSLTEIEAAIHAAKKNNKIVLLDFWASWCVSCKEMDEFTFSNPSVRKQLDNYVLLRVDVTANSEMDKAIQKHFNVFAPPTILFFDQGKELSHYRIIGEMTAEDFLKTLNSIEASRTRG